MIEFFVGRGPLEADQLRAVSDLYGRADAKYRNMAFVEHLLLRGPAGPAYHAFAIDAGRPVGHCAVVPMHARVGSRDFRCGKVEALFLEDAYRGRRGAGRPIVLELLERLFAFAEADDIELLHAFVRPEVGRVFIGFERVEIAPPGRVAVVDPAAFDGSRQRARAKALAAGQKALRGAATAAVRMRARDRTAETIRRAAADDADLVERHVAPAQWTVTAERSWDWYRDSKLVRVLELAGPDGSRSLVQVPGSRGEALRIAAWQPRRPGLAPAVAALAAAERLALRFGAGTVRFQLLDDDASLARASRLRGYVRRPDFSTLYVRARDAELAAPGRVDPTPLLFLGF